MNILNFAWGSHVDISRFAKMIGGQPRSQELAHLSNYRITAAALLKFPPEGADLAQDGGAPKLIQSEGDRVCGVLYEITPAQWEALDDYERAWGFAALDLAVETDSGHRVTARVHNLVEHGPFKAPSEQFLSTMRTGYKALGYSQELIERAIAWMTEP